MYGPVFVKNLSFPYTRMFCANEDFFFISSMSFAIWLKLDLWFLRNDIVKKQADGRFTCSSINCIKINYIHKFTKWYYVLTPQKKNVFDWMFYLYGHVINAHINIGQFKGHKHGLMKSRGFEIEQKRIVYIFDCVPVSAAYRSFSRKPTSPTSNVYVVYYNGPTVSPCMQL